MDVGVDLNAKYAIMCRKTVLIPENDEESTHSVFRQYFDLQQGYFQETVLRNKFKKVEKVHFLA